MNLIKVNTISSINSLIEVLSTNSICFSDYEEHIYILTTEESDFIPEIVSAYSKNELEEVPVVLDKLQSICNSLYPTKIVKVEFTAHAPKSSISFFNLHLYVKYS